jgi:hypothetical protein
MRMFFSLVAIPILVFLGILMLFIKDEEYDPYPENKTKPKRRKRK